MTWPGRVKVERYEITSGFESSGAGAASLGFALKMTVKDLVTSHPGPPIRTASIQFRAGAGTASGALEAGDDFASLSVILPPEQLHPFLFAFQPGHEIQLTFTIAHQIDIIIFGVRAGPAPLGEVWIQ